MPNSSSILNPLRKSKRFIQYYLWNILKLTCDFRHKLYYRSLKNKYTGRKAFVIGNGPSLKISDLTRLQNFVSFASNKIYLAFDKTDWRPTFFTIQDPMVWQKTRNELSLHFQEVHVENTDMLPVSGNLGLTIHKWHSLGPTTTPYQSPSTFSGDLSIGAYGGYSVTYLNLQFAVHVGCDPIYLIGCDHYYQGENDLPANSTVTHQKQNHFIEGYRKPGELVYNAPISDMTAAYSHARAYADEHGITIRNATRGGHLEVFERIGFDDLVD